MALEARTIAVAELDQDQVQRMACLMQAYYFNVAPRQFRADLDEKDFVILLYDGGQLYGFSTWMVFEHTCAGRCVNVIFSGDTIIDRSHWRSLALPLAWGHLMLSVLARAPERDLYWLLTSKGYKTYRFLPVFFREFHPSCLGQPPAFESALLRSLAGRKFGERFDPASWTIRATDDAQRLRPGVADIADGRRRDRHVAFFERANPGHARGDELVCIARCHPDNLTPYIVRQLRKTEARIDSLPG